MQKIDAMWPSGSQQRRSVGAWAEYRSGTHVPVYRTRCIPHPTPYEQESLCIGRICIVHRASPEQQVVSMMGGGRYARQNRGVGAKEQREYEHIEYEHIKESAEKSGRYGSRAKEVAARTVMKHDKEEGHKKGQ